MRRDLRRHLAGEARLAVSSTGTGTVPYTGRVQLSKSVGFEQFFAEL